jgi:hypothetical protein
MKSLFNALRVAWLFMWAGMATVVLGIPVTIASFLSRTGNLAFSLSEIWAYIIAGRVFSPHQDKKQGKDGERNIICNYFQPPIAL